MLSVDQVNYFTQAFYEQEEVFRFHITDWDSAGWIFVENDQSVGTEGSGVWVDPLGDEHQGPVGPATAA
jgi:hypothetical protein